MRKESEQPFSIDVDGDAVAARPGQTLAAALTAAGKLTLRHSPLGRPRGIFCGMGVCFECLITVDGFAGQRACLTLARPGQRVSLAAGEKGAGDGRG